MQHFNESTLSNKYLFASLVLFIVPISGLAIDIYAPSLPFVARYFHINNTLTQLTITAYVAGLGLMQLVSGSISDSFGRRIPFLLSMIFYVAATFMITYAQNIEQLLFLRFMQGMTVSILIVPMRSVIPDLFEGQDLNKMMNYMVMAWSIGPLIAPAIGAHLQLYFGWKANFYFLGLYGIAAFIMVFLFLPETSRHRHPFSIREILTRNKTILLHPKFLNNVMVCSLLYSLLILFAVTSPFIIQNALHFSVTQFGYIALLIGIAWFLGAMTNRIYIHIDLRKKEKICFALMFSILLLMLLIHVLKSITIYNFIIPIFAIIFLGGVLFPNYSALVMSLFPTATGSSNALLSSILFFISALSSILGAFLKPTSPIPLEIVYGLIVITCYLLAKNRNDIINKIIK